MTILSDGPHFTRLPWRDALSKLNGLSDQEKVKDLLSAADKAAKTLGKSAFVYLATYCFADEIVASGRLTVPASGANGHLPEGLTGAVPLCVVLRNQVEVFLPGTKSIHDNNGWVTIDNPTSLRLLGPGDVFGTFEAVDRMLGQSSTGSSVWEVSAGVRTAQLIYPLKSKPVRSQLEKLLGRRFETDMCGPFYGWQYYVLKALSRGSSWRAETIVFPQQWEEEGLAWEWRKELLKSAWQRMQVDKGNVLNGGRIAAFVNSHRGLNTRDSRSRELLIAFFRTLDAAAGMQIPVFVPHVMGVDGNEGGPFDQMMARFVEVIAESHMNRNTSLTIPSGPIVFVPQYLGQCNRGLLSFKHSGWLRDHSTSDTARTNDARAIAETVHAHLPELEKLIPGLNWGEFRMVLSRNAGGVPSSCIKPQDLQTLFEASFQTSVPNQFSDSRRIDTSHSFFSPSIHITSSTARKQQ
jgi:hypothetical protein